jgi:hypothetical protein
MEDWMITTPKEDMDLTQVLQVQNLEQRQELIRRLGWKYLLTSSGLEPKILDSLTGEELYNKYPVGNYSQTGDVVYPPAAGVEILGTGFKHADPATQIRLRQGVYYKLLELDLTKLFIRNGSTTARSTVIVHILEMGNPSMAGEVHFECVSKDNPTIFQAILERNSNAVNEFHPGTFNWKESKGSLPYQLS